MTFVAAGKPPPSPAPSRNRLTASMPKPVARLWLAQASDQKTMMSEEAAPRAEPIDERAAARVHQRVRREGSIDVRRAELRCCVSGMSCWIAATATGSDCRSR